MKRGFFDAQTPKAKASSGSKTSDDVITLKGKKDRIGGSSKAIPGRFVVPSTLSTSWLHQSRVLRWSKSKIQPLL
eukprot:1182640-Prorocentrum_minimum.AAC.4